MKATISASVGKGSLAHNRRKFYTENVDPSRTYLNIEYCYQPIRQVYHELFDQALAEYNDRQTRGDRKITNYYNKIAAGKQEKTFHELVVQIGNKDTMGSITEQGTLAGQLLDEYMKGFRERNPYLRVFSAHLHMDESTPHLHIDFVPFTTGSTRGLSTRVSLKQALGNQGFKGEGKGNTEWAQWAKSEKRAVAEVMAAHGIEWEKLDTHREHLSVLDYKKEKRTEEVAELELQKSELEAELAGLTDSIAEKQAEAAEIDQTLEHIREQQVGADQVDRIKPKKAILSDNVTLSQEDFRILSTAAKKYAVSTRKESKLQKLLDAARREITKLKEKIGDLLEVIEDLKEANADLIEQTSRRESVLGRLSAADAENEIKALRRENSALRGLLKEHGIEVKGKGRTAEH